MFFKLFYIFSIIIILLLSFTINALEVTLSLPTNETLSKTNFTEIPGSLKIIIDRKKIKKYSNNSLAEIIEIEAGIKARSIYGGNFSGSKTTIDIRGMGAQAKSNVLILINGQRLNNIDMSEIDFPSIPINSINYIEIFKGSAGSQFYGDGVIGGVINFITNGDIAKNKKDINEIKIKTGSYNSKEVSFNNTFKVSKKIVSSYFNHSSSDGYRDENNQIQNNFSSKIIHKGEKFDHYFDITFNEQVMSTPSDRNQVQLYTDRRGSDTPDDYINSIGGALMYGSKYNINDLKNLVINGSYRIKDSYSDLQSTSYPSYSYTSLNNLQFSPRLNNQNLIFGKAFKTTIGIDFQYLEYESDRKQDENSVPLHKYDAWQINKSIYLQENISISKATNLGFGFRYQNSHVNIKDSLDTSAPDYAGWQTEHLKFSQIENNVSINLGTDKKVNKNIKLYGRVGSGYRYPNIDDRIGGSGDTSLSLKTQKTQDIEFGTNFSSKNIDSNISLYLIEGENELAYDTDALENINMNSTRRYGIELNTKNFLNKNLILNNSFTLSKAKYTSGDQGTYATNFNGNDVPLVPNYSLDSILEYDFSNYTKIIFIINYQDDMRMESDDENYQNTKIPSHLIQNITIQSNYSRFSTSVGIKNIFDTEYFNYAVASSNTLGAYNAYPEAGRQFFITLGINY